MSVAAPNTLRLVLAARIIASPARMNATRSTIRSAAPSNFLYDRRGDSIIIYVMQQEEHCKMFS
jgi:hypothetical protein